MNTLKFQPETGSGGVGGNHTGIVGMRPGIKIERFRPRSDNDRGFGLHPLGQALRNQSTNAAVQKISVIVPCFNEAAVLPQLFKRLGAAAATWGMDYEVICVDDGSRDNTWPLLKQQHAADPRWRGLSFARNFGHQTAVSAGLFHAIGNAVVIIDADLQDPPEEVARLIAKWREGFEVVFAVRTARRDRSSSAFLPGAFTV